VRYAAKHLFRDYDMLLIAKIIN